MAEKPPEPQLGAKNAMNTPVPFGTSNEALSLVVDQMHGDLGPIGNSTKELQFQLVASLQKRIEARYQHGDRLLSKTGIVWVWKLKNGSQIGEVIPHYVHSKYLLTPRLQQEVAVYLRDQKRSADQAKSVKNNSALERSRPYIEQQIQKDFPEVGDVENHVEFWSAVYHAVEDGYYKYQLAKEFQKGSKITDPAVRKQVRDMGFVLINPKTGGFAWFVGGSTKEPVRGVVEKFSASSDASVTPEPKMSKPERDALSQQDINSEMWKKGGLTGGVFESIQNGDSGALHKALSYADTFVKKYPQLDQINKDIEVYVKAIHGDIKAGKATKATKDVMAKYQNGINSLNLQQQLNAMQNDGSIPERDLNHYSETMERIFMALTPRNISGEEPTIPVP